MLDFLLRMGIGEKRGFRCLAHLRQGEELKSSSSSLPLFLGARKGIDRLCSEIASMRETSRATTAKASGSLLTTWNEDRERRCPRPGLESPVVLRGSKVPLSDSHSQFTSANPVNIFEKLRLLQLRSGEFDLAMNED
jgi:hypothetical protein